MGIYDVISSMFNPSTQDGYDQGAALNVLPSAPQTPIAQAMQTPTYSSPAGFGGASAMPPGALTDPSASPSAVNSGVSATPAQTDAGQAQQAANALQNNAVLAAAQPDPSEPQAPMGPQMNPQLAAMLQNQAQNPNAAFTNGLLNAGAAMGSASNFTAGMGEAGKAFGQGFNGTLDAQRDLNTPRVTPMADGAFSMVQVPGQQPQLLPNGQVQSYLMGQKILAARIAMGQKAAEGDMKIQENAAKADQANGNAAIPVLTNLQSSKAGLAAAQGVTDALKSDSGRSTALKMYSAMPATAQRLAAASGNPTMTQAASDFNTLNNARLDAAKLEVSGLNGSLSNEEWSKSLGAVPSVSDSPGVWDTYYQRANPLLDSRTNFYQGVVQRGQQAGNRQVNPYGSNGRPDLGSPSTPYAPGSTATVSSDADFKSLPSGALFRGPDNVLRRKP